MQALLLDTSCSCMPCADRDARYRGACISSISRPAQCDYEYQVKVVPLHVIMLYMTYALHCVQPSANAGAGAAQAESTWPPCQSFLTYAPHCVQPSANAGAEAAQAEPTWPPAEAGGGGGGGESWPSAAPAAPAGGGGSQWPPPASGGGGAWGKAQDTSM